MQDDKILRIYTLKPISSNFSLPGLPGKTFRNVVLNIHMEEGVPKEHVCTRKMPENEGNTHFFSVTFQCQNDF